MREISQSIFKEYEPGSLGDMSVTIFSKQYAKKHESSQMFYGKKELVVTSVLDRLNYPGPCCKLRALMSILKDLRIPTVVAVLQLIVI